MNRSRALALLACALMLASAYSLQPAQPDSPFGLLALIAGTLALGASLRCYTDEDTGRGDLPDRPADSSSLPLSVHGEGGRGRGLYVILGLLGLALVTEISGNLLGLNLLPAVSHHAQFALFCISLILLTWGLGGGFIPRWPVAFLPLSMQWRGGRGVRIIPILAITLLALILRFWQLGGAVRFLVDESNFVEAVLDFSGTYNVPLLAPFRGISAFPWLYPYVEAQTAAVFGRSLDSLRAVSALLGALTIPALYLLAKTLFDRRIALIAAVLLATFPPHLQFSRLAINNIADPFFGTLALACLAHGLRHEGCMTFAVGGVALGLTQYFYEGGRLLYPALVILWLALLAIRRPDGFRLSHHLLIFLLAALVAALPVYATLYGQRFAFTPRVNATTFPTTYWQEILLASGDSTLLQQHLRHMSYAFTVYVRMPDSSLFYLDSQPMLLVYVVPLFLLGLGYTLWRIGRPGVLLVALWIILTSLGSSLLTNATHYARFVVVHPALMLLAAVGLRYTLPLLIPSRPQLRAALAVILVAAIALGQTLYFFGPHLADFTREFWARRPYYNGQDAVMRALDFPPGTHVHLVSAAPYPTFNEDMAMIHFLAPDLVADGRTADRFNLDYVGTLPRRVDHAFFLEPDDTASLSLIRQYFTLDEPQYSPWRTATSREFVLYYARYRPPGQ